MSPRSTRPTDAELEILMVLWSRGPSTAREVFETLRRRRRSAQPSTVLKFLQIMAQKGIVIRDESERAHVYAPSQRREVTQQQLAGDLLQRGFDRSMEHFMIGALAASKVSKKELAELRRILDDYEKRQK